MSDSQPSVVVAAAGFSGGHVPQAEDSSASPMPPPPSKRAARTLAAAAGSGMAGAQPLQPALSAALPLERQRSVIIREEPDPRRNAPTLPPRAAREAADHDAPTDSEATAVLDRPPVRRRHWPLISLATVVLTVTAYTVAGSVLTEPADASETGPRTPSLETALGDAPGAIASHRSVLLPPELAARLAQAVPPAVPRELAGDAGAPTSAAAAPTEPASAAPPTPPPVHADPLTAIPSPMLSESPAAPAAPPREAILQPAVDRRPPGSADQPPAGALASREEDLRARAGALHASLVAERLPLGNASQQLAAQPRGSEPSSRDGRRPRSPQPRRAESSELASRSDALAETTAARPGIAPITVFTFEPQHLFHVAAATMRVTDVALEPGERLLARPTVGDGARWVITVLDSGPQVHIFIKPLRSSLVTNLTLTTDRRSYFLELTSGEQSYMAGVHWRYPNDDAARRREALARAERERQSTTAIADLQSLRFDYQVRVAAGEPSWKPSMVFDDGEKTFIRFPKILSGGGAPALFVLRCGGTRNAQYVNYRVKGDLYVIDRVIDSAELRLTTESDAESGVVRITRRQSGG
jgi:type IV secretion system protein TrbG